MPLIVNGTTIPTNVASVLSFNGTNITNVVCNGTTVWTQSLFSGVWSGTTEALAGNSIRLETSGNAYRIVLMTIIGTYYGNWLYANSSTGIVDGTSTAYNGSNITYYLYSTTSTLRYRDYFIFGAAYDYWGGFIYFNTTSKFSGSSLATVGSTQVGFVTSVGLIAAYSNGVTGNFISLT